QLAGAFEKAGQAQRPAVILARTVKGKGISFMENVPRWHTRLMTPAELTQARQEIETGDPHES
ncbi:MAG: hypothetical protein GY697_10530, partial [Desulfobacterales bacterium]|nr:hypothetical protein [Desulfobacterales bacterium]